MHSVEIPPGVRFQEFLKPKIAYTHAYAPHNLCVGFVFDAE